METLKVLSLDGGGVRCVIGVKLLARLERYLGGPIHEKVDMVIGTSAGAIAGCCLSMGMSAREIDRQWDDFSRSFFPPAKHPKDYLRRLTRMGGLTPKYEEASLIDGLKALFGEKTLGELTIPHTMAVAYNPGAMQVHVFCSSDPQHSNIPVWEACRASGAGPTFFSEAGPNCLIDGGVIANNPTTLGILHGIEKARRTPYEDAAQRLLVISVGSGLPVRDRTVAKSMVQHARRLLDIMMYTDLGVGNFLLPKDNYYRLQPLVPDRLAVTDNHSRLPELREFGSKFAKDMDPTLRQIAWRLNNDQTAQSRCA